MGYFTRTEGDLVAAKLKIGDEVIVIFGCNEGQRGRILSIDRKRECVIVGGVMMMEHHNKARRFQRSDPTDGVKAEEVTTCTSSIMYYEPAAVKAKLGNTTKKIPGTRIRIREEVIDRDSEEKAVRVRVFKATGKDLQWLRR